MTNHVALYMIVFFLFYALQGHLAYLICLFYLMDSHKYKYRCITIGHKSPTWLIHPHPAPQKISRKEISRKKIPSLIRLNYNSNNLNHTEHSKVYNLEQVNCQWISETYACTNHIVYTSISKLTENVIYIMICNNIISYFVTVLDCLDFLLFCFSKSQISLFRYFTGSPTWQLSLSRTVHAGQIPFVLKKTDNNNCGRKSKTWSSSNTFVYSWARWISGGGQTELKQEMDMEMKS